MSAPNQRAHLISSNVFGWSFQLCSEISWKAPPQSASLRPNIPRKQHFHHLSSSSIPCLHAFLSLQQHVTITPSYHTFPSLGFFQTLPSHRNPSRWISMQDLPVSPAGIPTPKASVQHHLKLGQVVGGHPHGTLLRCLYRVACLLHLHRNAIAAPLARTKINKIDIPQP